MIKLEDFSELYDVSLQAIYVAKSTGAITDTIFTKRKGTLYIDADFITRRVEFRKRVWLKSHDNYYFITSVISENRLAGMLSKWYGGSQESWVVFMGVGLFAELKHSFISYQVPYKLWVFFRMTTWLIQIMFRRLGVPKEKRDKEVMICR